MVNRWDNIEILQAIDRRQQETYRGGPMRGVNGLYLMEQIRGDVPIRLPSAKSGNTAILFPRGLYAGGQLHAVKITVRSSVNVSIGYRPPTRPMPLAVPAPPPNGRWLSQWLVVTLMLTMPLRTFSA